MKVLVTTTIVQELEVPEGWDKFDIFDFLAEYQSFRGAYQGVTNAEETATIVDLHVVDEIVTEMGEVAYDD
jgi:hypothetical protein